MLMHCISRNDSSLFAPLIRSRQSSLNDRFPEGQSAQRRTDGGDMHFPETEFDLCVKVESLVSGRQYVFCKNRELVAMAIFLWRR